jgi:hypothetical protein
LEPSHIILEVLENFRKCDDVDFAQPKLRTLSRGSPDNQGGHRVVEVWLLDGCVLSTRRWLHMMAEINDSAALDNVLVWTRF